MAFNQEWAQIAGGVVTGAIISSGVIRYLVTNWLNKREVFEARTAERFEAIDKTLNETANTLRANFESEVRILRDRSHDHATKIGVSLNRGRINQKRLEVLDQEFKQTVKEFGDRIAEVKNTITETNAILRERLPEKRINNN